MTAYYSEWDAYPAEWLRRLIAAGHLPAGYVDERDIREVEADDVRGFQQAHFFAGIGGWPLALRLAGWPDEQPVWTGSPPCQPFSAAGKRRGVEDERHLAPTWLALVRECRPPVLFGEQVAPAVTLHGWLDALFDALEDAGYACEAAVVPACGLGAPHIRLRLFFGAVRLADTSELRRAGTARPGDHRAQGGRRDSLRPGAARRGDAGRMADADGCERSTRAECTGRRTAHRRGADGWLSDADGARLAQRQGERGDDDAQQSAAVGGSGDAGRLSDTDQQRCDRLRVRLSSWRQVEARAEAAWGREAVEWMPFRDGKARPLEPQLEPLADGVSGRVGRLRAYGNAIVPAVAACFIHAFCEWAADRGHIELTIAD